MLLLVFATSIHCFSQKKNSSTDTVSITKDVYFDFDDFVKGYVVMPTGAKVYGLLRFNGNTVIFKDTLTQKTKRYGGEELKGFTAAVTDTAGITGIKLNGGFEITDHVDKRENKLRFLARGSNTLLKTDTFNVFIDTLAAAPSGHNVGFANKFIIRYRFNKLMVYGAKLSLYKITISHNGAPTTMGGVMMAGGGYTENIFYFKRKNEKYYTELPSGRRGFKKLMVAYLKDDPKLVDDINKDLLGYDTMDQIVDRYNQDTNAR